MGLYENGSDYEKKQRGEDCPYPNEGENLVEMEQNEIDEQKNAEADGFSDRRADWEAGLYQRKEGRAAYYDTLLLCAKGWKKQIVP